ncbi:hypothetical protein DSO57_1020066 [Entomophthora muscae]|uniref:Uncharacterized protein n=1 Tax=Entomophthora muscae TaxID=34485 RepID=A0ACC2TRG6_9FUNG|nr:hypothetical protein DSO57_1020066 [Entomophthora muscae]
MIQWLLFMFCFGEQSVLVKKKTEAQVGLTTKLELGEGLAWLGEGNFTKFHLKFPNKDEFLNQTACLFNNATKLNSTCWEVDAISYYITEPLPISPLTKCPRWGRCAIQSNPAMVDAVLARMWALPTSHEEIPANILRHIPKKNSSQSFNMVSPCGTSNYLYIKFILLKLNITIRLNSHLFISTKPIQQKTYLVFPITTPASYDSILGLSNNYR